MSLIELTVVTAIVSILAALVAVAVTGSTSNTRTVTRSSDIAEVQKAVHRWIGELEDWPTTTGAKATTSDIGVDEDTVAVDVNGDGTIGDGNTSTTDAYVVLIDWSATTPGGDTMYPEYIGTLPRHAGETTTIHTVGTTTVSDPWVINESGRVVVLIQDADY